MENPTLKIQPKKYTGESTVVSMRMPRDMVSDIDSIAAATGYTRTELMLLCLEFSLQHMEIEPTPEKERGADQYGDH